MMMSSRTFLLSAVLVVGAATAELSETMYYNDATCEDLNSTQVIDGAYGMTGLEAYDACTNLTSYGQTYMSSIYECSDNVATLTYYEDDACSGDVVISSETANNTCINGQIDRCSSDDSEWDIISEWMLEATFYSDADCSTATGVTGEYTMTEVLALFEMGSCESSGSSSSSSADGSDDSNSTDSSAAATTSATSSASSTSSASNSSSNSTSTNTTTVSAVPTVTDVSTNTSSSSGSADSFMNMALRCIGDTVGMVMYDGDDTTCADDFTMASKDEPSCVASLFEDGPYMMTTCSEAESTDNDGDGDGDGDGDDDVTSGGVSSLVGGGSCGWSIAAGTAATAALAAVLG